MKVAGCLLLAILSGCGEAVPPEPAWGVDIVYKILGRAEGRDLDHAARVIEKRLDLAGFPRGRVRALGSDRLSVRVPGVDEESLHRAHSAVHGGALLAVYELAPQDPQRTYAETREWPSDLKVYDAGDSRLLVRVEPAIRPPMILDGWAAPLEKGEWRAEIELSKEALPLDGPRAIVLENRLVRVVHFSTTKRVARIINPMDAEEAKRLVYILLGGASGLELGGGPGGHVETRGPESWTFYGLKPRRTPGE